MKVSELLPEPDLLLILRVRSDSSSKGGMKGLVRGLKLTVFFGILFARYMKILSSSCFSVLSMYFLSSAFSSSRIILSLVALSMSSVSYELYKLSLKGFFFFLFNVFSFFQIRKERFEGVTCLLPRLVGELIPYLQLSMDRPSSDLSLQNLFRARWISRLLLRSIRMFTSMTRLLRATC